VSRRGSRARAGPVLLAIALLGLALVPAPLRGAPALLPVALGREFLGGLSVAPTAPGGSSALDFELADPLPYAISNVTLTFEVYAFNPFPGTGRTAPPAEAPGLSGGGPAGPALTLAVGALGAHAVNWTAPVTVVAPPAAPSGTYAIRDRLSFEMNGTPYELASVGNFAPALWQNATVLPNGTPTVNLTRLGVSGILPETAILVRSNEAFDAGLYVLLGIGAALALAGTYVAMRPRGPRSRSGRSSAPEESQAPSALGKSRRSEGD
jgi:hypothetical protein